MKWIRKYYLIFIFLCAISSTSKGENNSVLLKADSLFSIGKYKTAAVEYERFIYFSGEKQDLLKTLYKKAQCYKQLSNFTKSFKTLRE